VEKNAAQIKEHWGTQKKVVLLGHSKGGVDAAAACSMFWNELKDKVVGLALIQSPYGGSPVAADILREGQIADYETRTIMEMLISKVIKVTC
jgi:pimeloyl-ACP methyl ester carboxylesterase